MDKVEPAEEKAAETDKVWINHETKNVLDSV